MIKRIFGVLALVVMFGITIAPLLVGAQTTSPSPAPSAAPSVFPTGYWGPILSCQGLSCATFCDFFATARNAMYVGLSIVLFIVLPLTIMYGGILVLTSAGNTEKVGEGKKAVTGALVGIAVALCAYLIVQQFYAIILPDDFKYKNWYNLSCDFSKVEILKPLPGTASSTTGGASTMTQ